MRFYRHGRLPVSASVNALTSQSAARTGTLARSAQPSLLTLLRRIKIYASFPGNRSLTGPGPPSGPSQRLVHHGRESLDRR
jgi:hypothetical protein